MNEWYTAGIREALSSTLGWACVVFGTLVAGFCAGYWIGHREITGFQQTAYAFVLLPVLWFVFPRLLFAFAVMGLAWVLPMRYDSPWLRIVAAGSNFLVWLVVIETIVEATAGEKFFRY